MFDFRFLHPFTCIVAGPTRAGKSTIVKKLVEYNKEMINEPPERIYWCYAEEQPLYDNINNVTFIKGMPDMAMIREHAPQPQLVILDDLMIDLKNDTRLTELFIRGSHHMNVSCIHIVQNIFYSNLRTSRINAQYLLLLKNPSDLLQVQVLARQLFPTKQKYFNESFTDSTRKAHGYLLIDLTQQTEDKFRLRTDIFPNDKALIIYVPKV